MLLHAILSQKCELGEGVERPPAMMGGREGDGKVTNGRSGGRGGGG